ncbi:CopD family protein [Caballeronia sp. LZ001]|uniref:CopD family protein n=1 Tax=Caballeronia sp. LZ001 TaxID=3038553 RepID=UPI0028659DFA|nr:CopD family protein [Caballeronia sp. LZ001]MDR5803009.1 CopD family protein [Caballeronia sp. LZ001]
MNGDFDFLWLAQVVFGALSDTAFACALGAALFDAWLCGERAHAVVSPAHRGWRHAARAGTVAAITFVACNFVCLWLQAAAMSGSPVSDAGASLWLVATSTQAGIGWLVALAGGLVIVLACATGRPQGASKTGFAIFGALVAAAGKAAIGHAADAGAFSLAEAVQTLHLLATGVWGGIVIVGALAVLPALGTSVARASLIRIVARMSRVATLAVIVIIATGVFNAWRGTDGSAAVLVDSNWGHALIVKTGLVLAALALGALNRWSVLPRLQRTASTMDAHTVINVMRLEAVLMLCVFATASVLSHGVPGAALAG